MMTLPEFIDDIEIVAAWRKGSVRRDTLLLEVVGLQGIGPKTFYKFVKRRLKASPSALDAIQWENPTLTVGDLYETLTAPAKAA